MMRLPEVLDAYRQELAEGIRYQYFLQYQFRRQWQQLRSYANGKGIKIIGDVPIYVPLDSADVWQNPFPPQASIAVSTKSNCCKLSIN